MVKPGTLQADTTIHINRRHQFSIPFSGTHLFTRFHFFYNQVLCGHAEIGFDVARATAAVKSGMNVSTHKEKTELFFGS
jgi:hypothetical protein